MMVRDKRIILSCIFGIALAIVCSMTIGSKAEDSKSTAITHGFAINNIVPSEVGEKGSSTNPTVILELVPDMKFAQLGYLFAGCEPVDINRMIREAKNGNANANTWLNSICSSGAAQYSMTTSTYKKFDLDPKVDTEPGWTYVSTATMTQAGYYERVADGTGLFAQNVIERNPDGTIKTATYQKVSSGNNFIWVPYETLPLPVTNHNATLIGDRVYTTRTDKYYINNSYRTVTYTHKNTFLKNVLQVPDSKVADYHVVVKTVTPNELNDNSQWIDRADLIFITNKTYNSPQCQAYKAYSKIPYTNTNSSDTQIYYSNNNDLNWQTVMKLFNKVVLNEDNAGIIIDQNVFTVGSNNLKNSVNAKQIDLKGNLINDSNNTCSGSNNNVFKLCLMLNTMDPVAFYNMYLYNYADLSRTAAITEINQNGRTTGSFDKQTGDAKTYWGNYTFMPPKLDGTKSQYSDWYYDPKGQCYTTYGTKTQLMYNDSTVNSKVYLFKGDMSLSNWLTNTSAIPSYELTKELMNYTKTTSASPAMAIQFIMGINKDTTKVKDSIKVLDLEPCTISPTLPSAKPYLTEALLRIRLLPTYTGQVNIVHQSTAEFNGKLEDLNSTYDMIYMGLYFGRFNTNNNGDRTVYNYSYKNYGQTIKPLDGKVYLHVGDKITCRNENEFNVNWPTDMNNITRGPGNDITDLKKSALENYLAAGLPIVTDTDLYKANSVNVNDNSSYIDATSIICEFVTNNKTRLLDAGNSSTSSSLMTYLKKTGLIIHMEEGDYPREYDGETSSGTIGNNAYISRQLIYRFTLEDSDYTPGTTYTAKLYIDASRDGTYSSDEVVAIKRRLVADGRKYSFTKTLGNDYVGAIPWKLVVSKDSNVAIRDSKEGFSAIKRAAIDKKVINILQITDPNKSTLNLMENVNHQGLFYKYTSNLNDYIIHFTTITTSQFEEKFNSNSKKFIKTASDAEKASRDKLKDYNMLIFGFADYYSNISNQYGALDNVMYYIDSGKSVLFTHDVTSYYNVASSSQSNNPDIKGYNFNLSFRDYLGMDRFGVRTTDPSIRSTKDSATSPSGSVYNEIQGYTYQAINRLANSGANTYNLYANTSFDTNPYMTTKAAKLNSGQITQYPYKIDDNLTIAETHSQYFQLDLNADDMIVWYTLAERNSDNDNGLFSCSANDAANNYYIYSKGNITYSGVGHSDMSWGNNDMEVKLFVNTMVAAYGNGSENPSVEVVNTGVFSKAPNEYSLYVSVDYAETTLDDKRYEEVAFIPRNNSLTSDILQVKASTKDGIILKIYDDSGTLVTVDTSGYATLNDGDVYYVRWPQSYLSKPDKDKISFDCKFTDAKGITYTGSATASLLRRNMFELD